MIITTEKDYVRLQGKVDNLFYLEIKNNFLNNAGGFNTEVHNYIKK